MRTTCVTDVVGIDLKLDGLYTASVSHSIAARRESELT